MALYGSEPAELPVATFDRQPCENMKTDWLATMAPFGINEHRFIVDTNRFPAAAFDPKNLSHRPITDLTFRFLRSFS